jgi:hypothetical protein
VKEPEVRIKSNNEEEEYHDRTDEAVVQLFCSLFFTEGKHEGEETEEITNTYNFEEII